MSLVFLVFGYYGMGYCVTVDLNIVSLCIVLFGYYGIGYCGSVLEVIKMQKAWLK